jgi:hypothetical protein
MIVLSMGDFEMVEERINLNASSLKMLLRGLADPSCHHPYLLPHP